jgi:Tfp pilus assembly protein PilF
MKFLSKTFLISVLCFLNFNLAFSQSEKEVEKIIIEGVTLNDKGEYQAAIEKFDQALALDKDNFFALAEKALTLLSAEKHQDAIDICKKLIKKYPKQEDLNSVYVTYANALDMLEKPKESIKIYNEGIEKFPNYFQLYFNRGIALANTGNLAAAIKDFQHGLLLNPRHKGSHNALARLERKEHTLPAIMAFGRYLMLDPQSKTAQENLAFLQAVMVANVEKTGEQSVKINVSARDLDKSTTKENNFGTTEMILTLSSALDFDEKNKDKTKVEQFIRKMEILCASLSENEKGSKGFYWEFYAPFFIEMKKKDFVKPFAYYIFLSSQTDDVNQWIKANEKEFDKLFEWSKQFKWKTMN